MITTHKLEQNKEEETKMKKLYEIIQEYESAGVKNHDLTLMKNLSRAGFEPDSVASFVERGLNPNQALEYNEAGVATIEEMLVFKDNNITPNEVAKYSSCGFSTPEQIRTIKEKKLDDGEHAIKVYSKNCGFEGDLGAIIELCEKGVSWGYAWILAKHGLKGDKKGMLEFASKVSYTDFDELVRIIANKLSGNIPYDKRNNTLEYGNQTERLRNEINPYDIVDLAETAVGKAFLKASVFNPAYIPCLDDDQELVMTYIKQNKEDHEKYNNRESTYQLDCQIQDKREEKLFEAYKIVKSSREINQQKGE